MQDKTDVRIKGKLDLWLIPNEEQAKHRVIELAGEVGIEPTNAGIKIRCLTTWLHPNYLLNLSNISRAEL